MAEDVKIPYNKHIICECDHIVSQGCKVYVINSTGNKEGTYLQTDGTYNSCALEGWFRSVQHAKETINKLYTQIRIGGE